MSKRYILILHVCFWILYLLVPELPIIFPDKKYPLYYYYYTGSTQILNIINFYVCYFLLSIDFSNSRRIVVNLLTILGVIAIFVFLRMIVMVLVYVYLAGFDYQEITIRFIHITVELVNTITFTTMALLIKFMIDWFNAQKQKSELKEKTKSSELALLRTQINPHFLFNTLNNLYSLVYKKSDQAPSVVMKLSEIMRYMLYDANTDKVLLEKEIEYLNSFIEINELRLMEGKFVQFEVSGEIANRLIPPMLLIPFVENAFKHGRKKYKTPGIVIQLSLREDLLSFDVMNYLVQHPTGNKDQQGGVGLDNVKKRLDLLYPGTHQLTIEKGIETFHVHLSIEKL